MRWWSRLGTTNSWNSSDCFSSMLSFWLFSGGTELSRIFHPPHRSWSFEWEGKPSRFSLLINSFVRSLFWSCCCCGSLLPLSQPGFNTTVDNILQKCAEECGFTGVRFCTIFLAMMVHIGSTQITGNEVLRCLWHWGLVRMGLRLKMHWAIRIELPAKGARNVGRRRIYDIWPYDWMFI